MWPTIRNSNGPFMYKSSQKSCDEGIDLFILKMKSQRDDFVSFNMF